MALVEVFGIKGSPACRIALLALEVLEVPYELRIVNPVLGDTRKSEYLALNPQHSVPFYRESQEEGGFSLNESKAILTYLADKHSDKNDKLYPKDLKTRAVVIQRIMFDTTFFNRSEDVVVSLFVKGSLPTEVQKASLKEALGWLNDFVKPTGFAAGTTWATIADLSLAVTYFTLEAMDVVDMDEYPELKEWIRRVRVSLGEEAFDRGNMEGAKEFKEVFQAKMKEALEVNNK